MDENPYQPPEEQRSPRAKSSADLRQHLRSARRYSLLTAGIGLAILFVSGDDRDVFVIVAPITACIVVAGVLGWLAATIIGLFR